MMLFLYYSYDKTFKRGFMTLCLKNRSDAYHIYMHRFTSLLFQILVGSVEIISIITHTHTHIHTHTHTLLLHKGISLMT